MSLGIIQGVILIVILSLIALLFKPKKREEETDMATEDDWGVDDIQKVEWESGKDSNRYTLTGNYFDDRQEMIERDAWIGEEAYAKVRDSILNDGKVIYID